MTPKHQARELYLKFMFIIADFGNCMTVKEIDQLSKQAALLAATYSLESKEKTATEIAEIINELHKI